MRILRAYHPYWQASKEDKPAPEDEKQLPHVHPAEQFLKQLKELFQSIAEQAAAKMPQQAGTKTARQRTNKKTRQDIGNANILSYIGKG